MNDAQSEKSTKARTPEQARAAALARWGKKQEVVPQVTDLQPPPDQPSNPLDIPASELMATVKPLPAGCRLMITDAAAQNILQNIWAYVYPYAPKR